MYLHMSSKNIGIREDVYKKLKGTKSPEESFSDAIEKLLERKCSLLPLWSTFSGYNTIELIETDLNAIRSGVKVRT
jgi:predicted CopG family antitoxin